MQPSKERLSQHRGKKFERRLERFFTSMAVRGYMEMEKNETPYLIRKRTKQGLLVVPSKKAQCDYSGIIRGGKAVRCEAKWTGKLPIPRSRVADHQMKSLIDCVAMEGKAYVVVGHNDAIYFVPAIVWKDMEDWFGRKSMGEEELSRWQLNEEESLVKGRLSVVKRRPWVSL